MLLVLLPQEILNVIGAYLTTDEILTCRTVCSSWYKLWISYQYDTVHVKGKIQFRAFFHTLQQSLYKPGTAFSIGYQIRKLIVDSGHINPFFLGQLPILCPFLEAFIFDGVVLSEAARREPFQHYQQQRNKEELDRVKHNFLKWTQMRHIGELNAVTVSLNLLQLPTNLISISVQFNNQNDRTNSKGLFLNSLSNAPLLQSFSLGCVYLSLEELETIHASCPNLKSLHLMDILLLLPTATLIDRQIVPAFNLQSFNFINGSFCDATHIWLSYISRKYINAKTVNIGECPFFAGNSSIPRLTNNELAMRETQLLHITRSCTKLKSLNLQTFLLGEDFFKSLDQGGIQLNELTIGDGRTINIAPGLKALLNSQQRNHMQNLTVYGWPLTSDLEGLHMLMTSLSRFKNITALSLCLGRHFHQLSDLVNSPESDIPTLYFDIVLQSCPQLTSLLVTNAKITAADFFAPVVVPGFPLETLNFKNVLISNSDCIFQIISSHCRQLKSLSLISTVPSPIYPEAQNFNIYLPHHSLKMLALDKILVSKKCNTHLGTSKFKLTSSREVFWYDLIAFEYYHDQHFVYNQSPNSTSQICNILLNAEKVRAKKVKKWQGHELSYTSLDKSAYVSVCCEEIEFLSLSGLHII